MGRGLGAEGACSAGVRVRCAAGVPVPDCGVRPGRVDTGVWRRRTGDLLGFRVFDFVVLLREAGGCKPGRDEWGAWDFYMG